MPLKTVDLNQYLAPLEWLVEGLILRGYINTIASLPGEGKTALLTALAWQATRPAGELLARPVEHGATVYVDFDAPGDGRSVRYWLDKHQRAYPDGDLDKIVVLEPDVDTYGLATAEISQLTEVANETKAKLILVDAFSSAFPNVDPIKLVQVQGPLWHLRRLATETNAAVVLIDHLPKPVSGEKVGARGVIGSIAKTAQARAVHLLSSVAPNEVEGKHVLRWDCSKMSYSARPKPFGVELKFEDDGLRVELAELPKSQSETRTERAVRAMQAHLETHRGLLVTHQELMDIAAHEGNLRRRASIEAVQRVKAHYGDDLITRLLPGRGQPQGYSLKLNESEPASPDSASLHQRDDTASYTQNHSVQDSLGSSAPNTSEISKSPLGQPNDSKETAR